MKYEFTKGNALIYRLREGVEGVGETTLTLAYMAS